MKNERQHGKSARNGNKPSAYATKKPFQYVGEARLANGDLRVKANDKPSNKYQ